MPHVPRAICGICNHEMRPLKNGVTLEAMSKAVGSYYKVDYDRWWCKKCGMSVYIGAGQPHKFHHEEGYEKVKVDGQFSFEE